MNDSDSTPEPNAEEIAAADNSARQTAFETLCMDVREIGDSHRELKPEAVIRLLEQALLRFATLAPGIFYAKRPPMAYCHACSKAGGADMPIYHDAPACPDE